MTVYVAWRKLVGVERPLRPDDVQVTGNNTNLIQSAPQKTFKTKAEVYMDCTRIQRVGIL